jgi:hypothetical protein
MLAESLPSNPVLLSVYLHFARNALLPPQWVHNFGDMLEPRWIVGTESLDQ